MFSTTKRSQNIQRNRNVWSIQRNQTNERTWTELSQRKNRCWTYHTKTLKKNCLKDSQRTKIGHGECQENNGWAQNWNSNKETENVKVNQKEILELKWRFQMHIWIGKEKISKLEARTIEMIIYKECKENRFFKCEQSLRKLWYNQTTIHIEEVSEKWERGRYYLKK